MITLISNNPLDLYKKAFLKVCKIDTLRSDPRNYKDTSAVLSLVNYTPDPYVSFDKHGFKSKFNYDEYIIGGNNWIKVETEHYNQEYLKSGKIENLIKLFKSDSFTRRGVISLWNNQKLDLKMPFPCTVYVWFRKMGDKLHMNCHMRADDAYKILLMDIHVATSLHVYISKRLKLNLGNYNHFVDSLHLYKEHRAGINQLYHKLSKK